jgi:hypothetical protein
MSEITHLKEKPKKVKASDFTLEKLDRIYLTLSEVIALMKAEREAENTE